MRTDLREAITRAERSLRAVTKIGPNGLIQLFDRLATIGKVMSISMDEALAACRAFEDNISTWARYMDDEGETDANNDLRCIAYDLYHVKIGWCKSIVAAERADRKNWYRGDVDSVCHGRWESRGGKHFVELWSGRYDYRYRTNNGGGSVCDPRMPVESAMTVIQSMIDRGQFLPDKAVLPMKRVS